MEITVGLAQMGIALGEPEQNTATAQALATEAAAQGADLLLLPELWPTGYNLEQSALYTAPLDAGHFALMAEMARAHGLYGIIPHLIHAGDLAYIDARPAPDTCGLIHGDSSHSVASSLMCRS